MHRRTIRGIAATCGIVFVLAASVLIGIDGYGKGRRIYGATGAIRDRQIVKRMVNSPVDAYRLWKDAGYRGRTVLYIAEKWETFDPGELIPAQMYRAYPLQLYNTARLLEEEHLSGVTFLYVAAMNGISREILSIVPEAEIVRMKDAARKVKNFRVDGRGVYISRQGFPRIFTTAAAFTGVAEPVLVYVGASYFNYGNPDELYRQLVAARVQTDCIVLCAEEGKGSVTRNDLDKLAAFARLIGMPPPSIGPDRSPGPLRQAS